MTDKTEDGARLPSRIPILKVITESILIPFKYPLDFLYSTLLLALPPVIMVILLEPPLDFVPPTYFGYFLAVVLTFTIVSVIYILAGQFNYWVRLSFLGPENIVKQSFRASMRQIRLTILYFIVLAICITGLSYLIEIILAYFFNITPPPDLPISIFYLGPIAIIQEIILIFFFFFLFTLISDRVVRQALGKNYPWPCTFLKINEKNFWRLMLILILLYVPYEIINFLMTIFLFQPDVMGPFIYMILMIPLSFFLIGFEIIVISSALAIAHRYRINSQPSG